MVLMMYDLGHKMAFLSQCVVKPHSLTHSRNSWMILNQLWSLTF